jgi:hypothetical protein
MINELVVRKEMLISLSAPSSELMSKHETVTERQ